ncbi:MAG TPA: hypothetical protein VGO29_09005 [Solirubrobacteraceae bacterium]|jgi:hypothetical protein|nr:hypothetical protein [Solirubrobacteraceae bacterium]
MKPRILIVEILVLLLLVLAGATSAWAGPVWKLNGNTLKEAIPVQWKAGLAEVYFSDSTAGLSVSCGHATKYSVGPAAEGLIGELKLSSCKFAKEGNGSCDAGAPVTVQASGLPWTTELYEEGGKVYGHIKAVHYTIECEIFKVLTFKDECSGTLNALTINVSSGVSWLLPLNRITCSTGGANSGGIKLDDILLSPKGSTLAVG